MGVAVRIKPVSDRVFWWTMGLFTLLLCWLSHNPEAWAQYWGEPVILTTDERSVTIEENYFGEGRTKAFRSRKITRDLNGNVGILSDFVNIADPTDPRSGQIRLRVVEGEVIGRAVTGPQAGANRSTILADGTEEEKKRFGSLGAIGKNVSHCQGGVKHTFHGLDAYGPTSYEALVGGGERRQRFGNVYRAPSLGCYAVIRDVYTELEEGVFTRTEERRLTAASRSVEAGLLQP